jgi:hypothetical protein
VAIAASHGNEKLTRCQRARRVGRFVKKWSPYLANRNRGQKVDMKSERRFGFLKIVSDLSRASGGGRLLQPEALDAGGATNGV